MAIADRVANYESGREQLDRSGNKKVRVIDVPDFLDWQNYPGVPRLGDAYPGRPELTVVSLDMEGDGVVVPHPGGDDAGANYSGALVRVGYSNTAYESDGEAIWETQTCIKGLTISGGLKYGGSGGADIEQPVTIMYCENTHSASRLVYTADWGLIKGQYNCVNANDWTPVGLDNTFLAGTLLFVGADAVRVDSPGTPFVQYETHLVYRFIENTLGWSTEWNPTTSTFVSRYPSLYASVNFSALGL
jgi:hypothetical protein